MNTVTQDKVYAEAHALWDAVKKFPPCQLRHDLEQALTMSDRSGAFVRVYYVDDPAEEWAWCGRLQMAFGRLFDNGYLGVSYKAGRRLGLTDSMSITLYNALVSGDILAALAAAREAVELIAEA